MKIFPLLISLLLITVNLSAQCPAPIPTNPSFGILGRTINVSNVQINGGGNTAFVAPGANFNVTFNWNIGGTITACPGCITYFYFGMTGTSVPGGPNGTSYPNTHCMGSVFANQSSNSSGGFTAPLTPGYYFITLTGTWTFWCHQYGVNHQCNRVIGMIVVGNPAPFIASIDSLHPVSTCNGNDGTIGVMAENGSVCYTYNWTGPNSYTNNTALADSIVGGTYTVTITDATGCDTIITYNLVNPIFTGLDLGPDTAICANETLLLDATTNGVSYQWQDSTTTPTQTVSSAGLYWVTVDSAGCMDSDTVMVSIIPIPMLELGADTILCSGDSLNLNPNIQNATFQWQDNSTAPTYTVNSAGQYWLTIDSVGCTESDTVMIDYLVFPASILEADTMLCAGATLTLSPNVPNVNYLWQDNSSAPTFLVNAPGQYWVTIDSIGCTTSDSITVGYVSFPTPFFGADTMLCAGANLILSPNLPNVSYLWQDNSTAATYTVNSPGQYSVTVDSFGCTEADTIVVGYVSFPTAVLGPDTALCTGATLTLSLNVPNVSYLWQDNSTNSTFTINTAGQYWVTLDSFGCTETDTITIDYIPLPYVNLGPDTILCSGASYTIGTNAPNTNYQWQDASTLPTYTVNAAGQYSVTADSLGCIAADTLLVTYASFPTSILGADRILCLGDVITLSPNVPNVTYQWQDGSTQPTFAVNSFGEYWVSLTIAACTASDTIFIDTTSLPSLNLGPDTTLCTGHFMELSANIPNVTYLWQNGSTNSNIQVTQAGTYTLSINHLCGVNTDEVMVEYCNCKAQLPTAFSPNGDAVNEVFSSIIDCSANIESYKLRIYNRWGQQVFESTNYEDKWDGTFNAVAQPVEAYLYLLEYKMYGKDAVAIRGELSLLR